MPNLRQRKQLFIAIAIAVIILLTLVAAPNSSGRKNDSGSTYGRNPDGYGAWYEYMSRRHSIERWRKPFSKFAERDLEGVTYIQVNSKADFLLNMDLTQTQENWVSRGNTLVIIGKYESTSAAPFESSIRDRESTFSERQIKIKTTRRYQRSSDEIETILGDRYGAVVWQEEIGKGKVIYCVTPYLAANAYRDSDNYQFLAELVSQNKKIWIDEYIHGYRDRETLARERQDAIAYLVKTPWFLLFIQIILIAVIAAIAALRRFGKPITPKSAIADNSTMYIDALAGVLELANSSDFVVEAIALDERRKLQSSLGLGNNLVDDKTLLAAYQQKSESSSAKLTRLLQTDSKQKISNAKLISFIEDWQQINRD